MFLQGYKRKCYDHTINTNESLNLSPSVLLGLERLCCKAGYRNNINKIHKYFVDLVASLKDRTGKIQNLLIEVKPEKQTKPPTITNRKKQSTMLYEKVTWAVNQAKWDAARAWSKSKGYTFIILNEKHLNSDK